MYIAYYIPMFLIYSQLSEPAVVSKKVLSIAVFIQVLYQVPVSLSMHIGWFLAFILKLLSI